MTSYTVCKINPEKGGNARLEKIPSNFYERFSSEVLSSHIIMPCHVSTPKYIKIYSLHILKGTMSPVWL
jgi:hypothetical protein